MNIWILLNIDPTNDAKKIRQAYAAQLKQTHPEDNPEGFRLLREAYEKALGTLKEEKTASLNPSSSPPLILPTFDEKKPDKRPPDTIVDQVNALLSTLHQRDYPPSLFEKWVLEGVFLDLHVSDAFQERLLDDLQYLKKFPKSLFLHVALYFDWHEVVFQIDHPLHLSLLPIVEKQRFFGLFSALNDDPSNIMRAVILDDPEKARAALDKGADLKGTSQYPLLLAAVLFAGVVIVTLIGQHLNTTQKQEPIIKAIEMGQLEKTKAIIESGYDFADPEIEYDDTPLFEAVIYREIDIVKYLLSIKGYTQEALLQSTLMALEDWPLQEANLFLEHLDLQKKEDLDVCESIALSAAEYHYPHLGDKWRLHHASRSNLPEGYTPLFFAVYQNDQEAINRLLESGAEDTMTPLGHSALMAAVYNGDLKTTRRLVERGSNLKQVYVAKSMTLLFVAARYGRAEVIQYLLSLGMDPDWNPEVETHLTLPVTDRKIPKTPLTAAIANRDLPSATLLLDAGADPNRLSNGTFHPLFFASRLSYIELVRLLYERGARA